MSSEALLTTVYAGLFYAASAVLVLGLGARVYRYLRAPAPFIITITPAPISRIGVVARMLRELIGFESLFKASKWTWLFGWVFHVGLLVLLLEHLRYFTASWWLWVAWIHAHGQYATGAFLLGLGGLWARRLLVDRVRYISRVSDHLMLALLVGIGASGAWLKYASPTNVVAVKAFVRSLPGGAIEPLPVHGTLLVHLGLVLVLILVFPFSKLLHAPGLFFAPTRYQRDRARL